MDSSINLLNEDDYPELITGNSQDVNSAMSDYKHQVTTVESEAKNESKPIAQSIKQQGSEEFDESTIKDDGEIEISEDDVYHLVMGTPSQQITNNSWSPNVLRGNRLRHKSFISTNLIYKALTQHSLKKGIEKFRKEAGDAIVK